MLKINLSYWEIKSWLSDIDFTIVGSGIVGLSCAIHLKQQHPKAKILIIEKGILPQGASTKNAGFACFGSLSEIIDDLKHHSDDEVLDLVKQRVEGLQLLRKTLGDENINYQAWGGYELFLENNKIFFEDTLAQKERVNKLLYPLFNADVFSLKDNHFGYQNIHSLLSFNQFEGQIDTGKMMSALLQLAIKNNIKILNQVTLESYSESLNDVHLKTNLFNFKSSHLCIATNGFASQLLDENVKPARAQVLITKPIKDLKIKGTFHLDRGYYYFRNIDQRVLFGGGRQLDFKGETTTKLEQTGVIQNSLEHLLKTTILPNTTFEIEHRWSGIMGVGQQKRAIVKPISNRVTCGVRLGGMGVAIGSLVGKELAKLYIK